MKKIITFSTGETQKLAGELAKKFIDSGGVVALIGELGAGKTTFAQGFAKGLGITEKIISPTFVLIREHQIPKSHRIFYHIDLYRLEEQNIKGTGIEEIFNNKENIVLIEWADRLKELPENTTIVKLANLSINSRQITFE
ncbi:MAG: tRNA (adenosine(37)-N6)-threonylcarbamoyltransferase complex ATPase subunit type 1 TsaE [Candidatus Daviesbacteria bacterium]|nr:tRNA (adenosine(37)-N6)-threonylcarbamoyltransferase complex ATPase subunit type 1 TsaE [Candidatus Daviesbacteria bacterium]